MAKRGAATSARPARPRRSAVKAGPVASRTAAAAQVEGFIDKFDPAMARLIRACRAAVRKRLPTTIELVYDNYNFFVIGYSSTERPSDCIVTLASNAKGVGLSFYYGSTLPDPPASCKAVARRTGSFVSADRKRCGNRPSPR